MKVFAILAYDGIEPIDIGATYGVLSMAKRIAPQLEFYVLSEHGGEIAMANGLRLMADRSFRDQQAADVLMVLGGPGWSDVCANQPTLSYLQEAKAEGTTIASVCTGAMILEAAGLLSGLKATTKVEVFDGETPPLEILGARNGDDSTPVARIVDTGQILTGGGVSLGIDMTLYLLQRFCGAGVAEETARVLEYSAAWQANADRLPDLVAL
ncbi:MAG: DJ-1/PfpI family protein [Pseudomonadota bacterium]